MSATRTGNPAVSESVHPGPARTIALTASPQGAMPEPEYPIAKSCHTRQIARHRVIVEVTGYHALQPPALLGQWIVHPFPHRCFEAAQRACHSIAARSAYQQKLTTMV